MSFTEKEEKEFNDRLATVEENCKRLKNIEDLAGQNRESVLKILRILEGKQDNGIRIKGVVERLENLEGFKNKFVKVVLWVSALVFAPLLGLFGFLMIKVLAHMPEIMKFIDTIEKAAPK